MLLLLIDPMVAILVLSVSAAILLVDGEIPVSSRDPRLLTKQVSLNGVILV